MSFLSLLGRVLGWVILSLFLLLAAARTAAALYFDGPFGGLNALLSAAVLLALLAVVFFVRPGALKALVFLLICAAVAGWWLTLAPSDDRLWQADVAQTPWAETDGETITLHHLRHCDYRTESDYTARWETRTVRLSQLTGLDFFVNYWGRRTSRIPSRAFNSPMARPFVSRSRRARKWARPTRPSADFSGATNSSM